MNRVRCFQFLASCLLVLSWAVPGFGEQHNPCISEWEIQVKKEPLLVLGNLPDGGKYKLGETVTVDGDLFVVPGLQHEVDVKCGKPPRAEKALIPAAAMTFSIRVTARSLFLFLRLQEPMK
jgi:hypothetical protein